MTFTITNIGTGILSLAETDSGVVQISGTNSDLFSITQPETGTIEAEASTTFSIIFTPDSGGTKTAAIAASIIVTMSDSEEMSYDLLLTGEGGFPEIEVSGEVSYDDKYYYSSGASNVIDNNGTVNFGTVNSSVPVVVDFTITNNGDSNLVLENGDSGIVAISGTNPDNYVPTTPSSVIPPEGSTEFTITFSWDSISDNKYANLIILTNDPDVSEYKLSLEGYSS